jgi:hypothetical protein
MRIEVLGRTAALLASVLVATACGPRDECEEAADKLVDDCEFSGYAFEPSVGECKDERKCRAECINDHSCSEVLSSSDQSFARCLNDCQPSAP